MNRDLRDSTSAPAIADVAVLTILPEAYSAVRRIFGLHLHETRGGYQWAWGNLLLRDGSRLQIVTGLPLDRENVAAATFVDAMLEAWSPKDLLLVDIGGGVRGRDGVRLGDVVTHTTLHYYDYHKVEDGRNSPRYLPLPGASARLRELSRRPADRGDTSWIEHIGVKRPERGAPRVLPGEMLVGGAIQSNGPRLTKLLKDYPKALVVEMEGVGAGRAVLDRSVRGISPDFLVIRGISDYCNMDQQGNQKTRERWRAYAAAAAAAHAYAMLLEMAPRQAQLPKSEQAYTRFSPPSATIDNLWEAARTVLSGRDRELSELRSIFSEETVAGQVRAPHVISGEAGMGKSVLAREIAEEVAPHYVARWWIDASDQLKIRVALREFAHRLGIPSAAMDPSDEANDEAKVHRFLRDLREALESRILGGRVLFVLDNVDDATLKHDLPRTTLRYLPPSACDVLITSQSSRWHPVAPTSTLLSGLDPVIGAKLIAFESGRSELADDDDVKAICESFAGRPLFLRQVASLLRDGESPKDFMRRLGESAEDALEVLPELEGFGPLWRGTYRMSMDRAEAARPGTRNLLETIAFLSPDPIPLVLLHAIADSRSGQRPAHVDASLATLTERSLLQPLQYRNLGVRSYTLHRIIAALVRLEVRMGGRTTRSLASAVSAISSSIPSRDLLRRPEGRRAMAIVAPHVESIASHILKNEEEEFPPWVRAQAAEACSMLGLHRRTLSEWSAAQDAHQAAVKLSDLVSEPGSAALCKVRLANVMRQRGLFAPAQRLLEEAVPLLKLKGGGRDYAWALTVHARILRARPDSATVEALPLLAEAARLLKSFEGDGNPNTRRQLSELHGYASVINRLLSNLDTAEMEAVEGLRTITGGMLPDDVLNAGNLPSEALLATHLRALGGVWRLRGDFDRALRAHRRALEIFEHVYSRDHTDVGRALDSLGRVQREWGDLEGALESFIRAEQISDRQFGPNYAHAGTAAVNRALVYLELRDSVRALEEAEKGLQIYRLAYDEVHNDESGGPLRNESTVWALFVRANALAGLGELKSAKNDHQVVLEWRETRYPRLHAHIASSHYALGDVLWEIGGHSRERALWHHRQALVIREHVFARRPDYWLAQSQARVGVLTADGDLLRLAYETFSSQLKPNHWRTREVEVAIADLGKTKEGTGEN